MASFAITTFYCFQRLESAALSALRESLSERAAAGEIRGLILLSVEGINGTISGPDHGIEQFKAFLVSCGFADITFKDSVSHFQPFRRFKIDMRIEIVALKNTDVVPSSPKNNHLSPAEWNEILANDPEAVVLDTRNRYETQLGKFRGALDPQIDKFSELPEFLEKSDLPRDRKILMYCTGGIRCEKAVVLAQQLGFSNVYQLDGGILRYLEEFPEREFEGECFVFDHRVAVDQALQPSQRYRLCPHCGNPGETPISCHKCGKEKVICESCAAIEHRMSCSKNCAYHLRRKREACSSIG